MTFAEFRAWFSGFCEGVGNVPTKEQWDKIKEKVGQTTVLEKTSDYHKPWKPMFPYRNY